jgi:hypothetical protein
MRQLTLLVAIVIAFFITLSLLVMSHTSSLRTSVLPNVNVETSSAQTPQLDEIAKQQAPAVNLDLIETDIIRTPTPALTQGHVIMPPLGNETIK